MIFNHSFNYQIPKKNEIIIIMVLRTFSTSALKKEKSKFEVGIGSLDAKVEKEGSYSYSRSYV